LILLFLLNNFYKFATFNVKLKPKNPMKKIVLICGAVALSFTAFSQNKLARPNVDGRNVRPERKLTVAQEKAPSQQTTPYVQARHGQTSGNSVQTVEPLGTAANALTAVGIRNFVWASPYSNTVMFTRRAVGGTTGPINGGRIFYDISYHGGATNTWDTANGPVFIPDNSPILVPSNGRYPQGAIYNPAGSADDSADAYMTYYIAALNNTNPSGTTNWGGNAYGTHKLDGTMAPTQHELVSDAGTGVWYVIPELMHMCKDGKTFALSESDWGAADLNGRGVAYDYNGTMIWQKGTFNTTTNDYDYTQQLVNIPAGDLPYNRWYSHPYTGGSTNTDPVSTMLGSAIAFNDNGQIGYMVCKLFSNTIETPDSSAIFHIYKTMDGGLTWNRTQNAPDFDSLDNLCVDSGFGMGITGQVFDVCMDVNNNLHIITVAGTDYMSQLYGTSQYYQENYGSLFDIYTTDGGATWWARKLMDNPIQEIYGVMGDPAVAANRQTYDNRPQITRSYDGTKLFFSWFETDTLAWQPLAANGGYNNQNPDMHVRAYDVTTDMWTPEYNMTVAPALGGDADGACYLASVAYYALDNGSGGYEVPTVIGTPSATSTNNNPDYLSPFQFKYLDGVDIPSSAYTIADVAYPQPGATKTLLGVLPTATHEVKVNNDFIVAPVRPNPFQGSTELMVQIAKPGSLVIEIRNVLGQLVGTKTYSNQSSGLHTYTIDGSQLEKGIYLYTVTYNGQQITQKMNVQ